MRKTIIILAALVAVAACGPKGSKDYHISENVEANLGKIKEADGKVSFRILAKNDLQDTLHPRMIYTPCGCTAAKPTQTAIAPGEEEIIEVTYNPAYRGGKLMEEIRVMYQDSPIKMRSFIICGEVIPCNHPIEESCRYEMGNDLYSSHKVLGFGSINPGETKDIFFRYGNGGKKKMTLFFEIPEEYQPYIRFRQPGRLKADQRDTVHVKLTMPEGLDSLIFAIQPMVNGKPTAEVINVRGKKR